MATPHIELFVDIVSPFNYIAFHILETSPLFSSVRRTYTPVHLGSIMKATTNRPPLSILNKGAYTMAHRQRLLSLFGVEMLDGAPDGFPHNMLVAQRALTVLAERSDVERADGATPADGDTPANGVQPQPPLLTRALRALWTRYWVVGGAISQAADVREVLARDVFGGDARRAEEVIERTEQEEVKARLKTATERAVREGAFGLPWMLATNAEGETRGFFGVDHMGMMGEFLGLDVRGDGAWRALL